MKRAFDPHEPELMDRPQPVTHEIEADLCNLVSLNRWFGSHRFLRKFLTRWLEPHRTYRVLDLGTGSGDLPRVLVGWARRRGVVLQIDAVDANPSTLEIARHASRDFPEITFLYADVLTFVPRSNLRPRLLLTRPPPLQRSRRHPSSADAGVEPEGLASEEEAGVAEVGPVGGFGEGAEFGEGRRGGRRHGRRRRSWVCGRGRS